MLPRTTPWAVAFAFVLLVATAGAATQKAPLFASVGAGLDLAGNEASAEAELTASVEVALPDLVPEPGSRPGRSSSGSEDDGTSRDPAPRENGTNGSQPPTNTTPPREPQPPTNGTGGNGTDPMPPSNHTPQKAPVLSPESQNVTGKARTTIRFDITLTNPDAREQRVSLFAFEQPGWSVNLSERNVTLAPGETLLVEGRVNTFMSIGGRATIRITAEGADQRDHATVHVCARGVFVDLCEGTTVIGGGSGGNSTRNATSGSNETNTTTPPASNATSSPPSDPAAPPPNGTSSPDGTPPPSNETASPSPPPSNGTSSEPASPPPSAEEGREEGTWVSADVGAEGEASSDGLRVEV